MKVIFLDVDGVLNSKGFLENNQNEIIDRANVSILRNVIDKTAAVIVMSSGWKMWFDENMMPRHEYSQGLYDIFCEFGITLFGKTPDFSTEEIRITKTFSHVKAEEIIAWLSEHKEVCRYVVIDDLDLKNEEISSHLVRISSSTGITEEDGNLVIDMLVK